MHTHQTPDFHPWPLNAADILHLAQIIQTTLLHFKQCHSSYEESYLTYLRIITHCYHLVMIEVGEHCHCASLQPTLNFNQHPEAIQSFAINVAEMINTVSDKTRFIDCPWFYSYFADAVKHILSPKAGYLIDDLDMIQALLPKILLKQLGTENDIVKSQFYWTQGISQ